MTRMHSVGDAVTSTIPAFLTKLWVLVEDETNNDLISWDQSGKSFHMFDQARFSKDVLPYYFKHNNMASFIRQLNMYGFRKVMHTEQGIKHEKEDMEFSHPFFVRGREDLLEHIKRKGAQLKTDDMKVWQDDVNKVLEDVQSMRGKQTTISSNLQSLERENAALWREVALLRQKHVKQEQIVSKFLVSLVRSNRGVNPMKRKLPLMINDSAQRPKPAKVSKFARQLSIEGKLDTAYEVHSPDPPIVLDESDLAQAPGAELVIQDVTASSPSHVLVDNLVSQTTLPSTTVTGSPAVSLPSTTVTESPADPAVESTQGDMEPLLAPGSNVIQAALQLSDLTTVPVSITLLPTPVATAADSLTTQDVITTTTPLLTTATSATPSKSEPQQVPTTSTSLTLSDNALGRITVPEVVKRDQMSDYVDGMQTELDSLKDMLSAGQYSLDADTLLGLFTPDAPLPATPDNLLKLVENIPENSEFVSGRTAHPLQAANTSGNILGNELIEYNDPDDFSSLFDLGEINSQSMLESQSLGFPDFSSPTEGGPSSELNTPEFDIASPLARRRRKTSKISTTSTEEVD